MEHIIEIIGNIGNYGYVILFVIVFFESFPLTFYLPGDSLLFTTGFLASQGYLSIYALIPTLFVASILGYNFSYFMGERLRNFILKSNDKYWFKKKHLEHTQAFFDKYGDKTIIIGRFVPIVRSFSPTLAGAAKMHYKQFTRDSILGGFIWVFGVTLGGYFLGRAIPGLQEYLTPIVTVIILISLSPSIYEYLKSKKQA
ncbi:MAG: VTT domain-containing protein [Minisyncoccia bacterium]